MSRGGWRPWKNTGGRDRQQETVPDAEVLWAIYRDGAGGVQLWPLGDWRDKVIESESFAHPQPEAEAGEPEIEAGG